MAEQGMKQKKPSRIKSTAKFLFNFSAWIGADNLRISTSWLTDLIKKTFTIKNSSLTSTNAAADFSEVMQRMNVSENDLPKQEKRFFLISLLFLGLTILSLFYLVYLSNHSSFLVLLAAFIVFILFLTRSYFYSFWCFQIKKKSLNCSFKEWLVWLLKGKL